jgi:hypothetical protein
VCVGVGVGDIIDMYVIYIHIYTHENSVETRDKMCHIGNTLETR